jgi:hypothetical protein
MNRLGELWAKKVFADDPDFLTLEWEVEGVAVLLVVHLPSLRWRMMAAHAGLYRADLTPLISDWVKKCAEEYIHFMVPMILDQRGEVRA